MCNQIFVAVVIKASSGRAGGVSDTTNNLRSFLTRRGQGGKMWLMFSLTWRTYECHEHNLSFGTNQFEKIYIEKRKRWRLYACRKM